MSKEILMLGDTLFKPKRKNKRDSYTQYKSSFSLTYFIIYFYVFVQELFSFRGKFMCYGLFRVSASHRD